MYLSRLIAITPNNDAEVKKIITKVKIVYVVHPRLSFRSDFDSNTTKKGWLNKPIPRSEMARLRRMVFSDADKKEVFFTAWIARQFKTAVEYDKIPFKMQLTINKERRYSTSLWQGRNRRSSLQNKSFDISKTCT